MTSFPVLTSLLVLPLAASLLVAFLKDDLMIRRVTLVASLAELVLALERAMLPVPKFQLPVSVLILPEREKTLPN